VSRTDIQTVNSTCIANCCLYLRLSLSSVSKDEKAWWNRRHHFTHAHSLTAKPDNVEVLQVTLTDEFATPYEGRSIVVLQPDLTI
jgi:hypothetical protein